MTIPASQTETASLLRELSRADPVETHISVVFVGDETVWKLKKAISLPFLDFTSADERRRLLHREIELNAEVAPGLYRDVVSVGRRPDGSLALNDGQPIDWVLRMSRVPQADLMENRLASGPLDPALLDALADAVATFHARAPVAHIAPAEALADVIDGNTRAARHAGLPEDVVTQWDGAAQAALHDVAPTLQARADAGLIRRAHGDLHLGNVCIWQGKPIPFDALEFDESLATIDLAYDLAFLLMDLDIRAGRAAANRVMNRYVARTGDAGLTAPLPLFLSLRAMVLAHVRKLRGDAEASARYLAAALAYLRPAPAIAAAIGGLPGTGKTTLARALAPEFGQPPAR